MIVNFKMIINEDEISFKSIGKLQNNVLTFKDMINKTNTIKVTMSSDEIIIEQDGLVKMKNIHILNKKTTGFYQGMQLALMETNCETTKMVWENNVILIDYEYYIDGNYTSNNKLEIIF